LPYPSFLNRPPVINDEAGLSAVGRCRIHPEAYDTLEEFYKAIVRKCVEQSKIDATEDKQQRKKLMKEGVAMAKTFLMIDLQLDPSIIDVELVVEPLDLVESDGCLAACFLDAGCDAIVTNGTHLEALDRARIPRSRLVAHFDSVQDIVEAMKQAAPLASKMSVAVDARTSHVITKELFAPSSSENTYQIMPIFQSNADIVPVVGEMSKFLKGRGSIGLTDPTPNELGLSYAACMRTDRHDGLFTTVVCTRSGEALGLVYSSAESLVAALECGRGVYYSRSRGSLWRKGDTSGHYQILHRIDVDCDGDALRFTVTQRGEDVKAFCHLHTLTCWSEPRGLRHLEQTLEQRVKDAPEGSYTKRLMNDEELLRNKLVEEAQELSEATTKQHVAEEFADVIYFSMVRAAKMGVSIDDIAAELDLRARKVTRRQGDSKAFRIAAGDAILSQKPDGGASS